MLHHPRGERARPRLRSMLAVCVLCLGFTACDGPPPPTRFDGGVDALLDAADVPRDGPFLGDLALDASLLDASGGSQCLGAPLYDLARAGIWSSNGRSAQFVGFTGRWDVFSDPSCGGHASAGTDAVVRFVAPEAGFWTIRTRRERDDDPRATRLFHWLSCHAPDHQHPCPANNADGSQTIFRVFEAGEQWDFIVDLPDTAGPAGFVFEADHSPATPPTIEAVRMTLPPAGAPARLGLELEVDSVSDVVGVELELRDLDDTVLPIGEDLTTGLLLFSALAGAPLVDGEARHIEQRWAWTPPPSVDLEWVGSVRLRAVDARGLASRWFTSGPVQASTVVGLAERCEPLGVFEVCNPSLPLVCVAEQVSGGAGEATCLDESAPRWTDEPPTVYLRAEPPRRLGVEAVALDDESDVVGVRFRLRDAAGSVIPLGALERDEPWLPDAALDEAERWVEVEGGVWPRPNGSVEVAAVIEPILDRACAARLAPRLDSCWWVNDELDRGPRCIDPLSECRAQCESRVPLSDPRMPDVCRSETHAVDWLPEVVLGEVESVDVQLVDWTGRVSATRQVGLSPIPLAEGGDCDAERVFDRCSGVEACFADARCREVDPDCADDALPLLGHGTGPRWSHEGQTIWDDARPAAGHCFERPRPYVSRLVFVSPAAGRYSARVSSAAVVGVAARTRCVTPEPFDELACDPGDLPLPGGFVEIDFETAAGEVIYLVVSSVDSAVLFDLDIDRLAAEP